MDLMAAIAERKIQEAMERGEFDDLPGKGKPLDLSDDPMVPEELRMAITLREMEGMSYEEIAQALECPIGTVRSRIFRAREAISQRIKPMLERQSGKRW